MKPTPYLILDKRRIKKDGNYSVKIRIVFLGQPYEYRTGLSVTEVEFENASVNKPKNIYKELKAKMDAYRIKANTIIDKLDQFSPSKFEHQFYGNIRQANDIFSFFKDYFEALMSEDRYKTAISYQTARNSLKKFKNKIAFHDITPEFLRNYHKWMIDNGNSETTIGIYLRSLRAIYNLAISEGVIKKDENYPFQKRKYSIPAGRNVKKALRLEEVALIMNYETIPETSQDKAKDFWTFSYLCNGINFKDISLLKNENIDGDMLRFFRAKTRLTSQANKTIISCYIVPEANDIIEKWRNEDITADAYLFPILSPSDTEKQKVRKIEQFIKNTNKYIKLICKDVGIEKAATTYYCRHSAATILKKSGATVEQIRELLGHKSQNTTLKYLASFDDDTKKALSKSLVNFKNKKSA